MSVFSSHFNEPFHNPFGSPFNGPGIGGGGGFNPALWFAASEQGAWYDPSDMSTLFQDSAGTTPVTAVEQPVGKILDKSGRGNHAIQATTAQKPVLSARKNLLTYSEDVTNAAWTKSRIKAFGSGSIANVAASGIATADFICEDSATGLHRVAQGFSPQAERVAFQCKLKAGGRNFATLTIYSGAENLNVAVNLTTGALSAITSQYGSFTGTASAELLPSGFWLVKLSGYRASLSGLQACISIGTGLVADFGGTSYAGDGVSGIYVAEAQFETSAAPTAYQWVNTATDYDTTFPLYERTDGVDDSQATAAGGGASTYAAVVMSFRTSSVGSAQTLFSDRSGNTGLKLEITAGGNIALSGGNGGSINTATGAAVTAGTDYVVTAIYDGASLSVQLNNGAATAAACALSAGTAAVSLGKDNGAATGFFLGRRYGVLYAKDAAKSAGDITSAKTFIGALAGITL